MHFVAIDLCICYVIFIITVSVTTVETSNLVTNILMTGLISQMEWKINRGNEYYLLDFKQYLVSIPLQRYSPQP